MAIVKWNPNRLMGSFFDDFFRTEFPEWSRRNFAAENATLPAINVKETDNDFQLEVAAPGMSKKDFNLELDKNVLTISAQKEFSNEEKDNGYTRKEFSYSSFQRAFTLPNTVMGEKISAKYVDGILNITIPKKPEAKPKPAKKIAIG